MHFRLAPDIRSLRPRLAPICLVFKDKTGASQSFNQFSKILELFPQFLAAAGDPRFNSPYVHT